MLPSSKGSRPGPLAGATGGESVSPNSAGYATPSIGRGSAIASVVLSVGGIAMHVPDGMCSPPTSNGRAHPEDSGLCILAAWLGDSSDAPAPAESATGPAGSMLWEVECEFGLAEDFTCTRILRSPGVAPIVQEIGRAHV